MTTSGVRDGGMTTARPRNGLGTAAMVVGLVALVLFWVWFLALPLGVVAIALGIVGRHRVKRGKATNRGMATAGVVLGGIAVVVAGALLALGVAFLNSDSGKDYNACIDKAGSQADRQQCAEQFGRDLSR